MVNWLNTQKEVVRRRAFRTWRAEGRDTQNHLEKNLASNPLTTGFGFVNKSLDQEPKHLLLLTKQSLQQSKQVSSSERVL